MRSPGQERVHGWHVDVSVAARARIPWALEVHGHTDGLSRHGLDGNARHLVEAPAAPAKADHAHSDLKTPHEENNPHPGDLGKAVHLQVKIETDKGCDDAEAVDVQEGLVEGMADGRPGLDADQEEGDGADHAPGVGALIAQGIADCCPSTCMLGIVQPGDGVDEGLDNGDPSSPAMEEIKIVVRNLKEGDQGIIAEGEEDGRDEVESCERARTTAQRSNDGHVLLVVREDAAPGNIESNVDDENDGMPAAGKGSIVNRTR